MNTFVRRIALHGVTAEIVAPRALKRTIDIVLNAYPEACPAAEPEIRITATRMEPDPRRERPDRPQLRSGWRVTSGERSYPEADAQGMAARRIEWIVISEAIKHWTRFIHVHAALLAGPAESALLIGRSGSGKSTTSVALALEGFALYTDDVALVDRETLHSYCVPRPIKLDQKARRLLRPRGLVVPARRRLGESIDRSVLPGLPPVEAPGPPVTAAIFFADKRGDRAELRPLTAAEAVLRLILQSASEKFDVTGPSDGAIALVNAIGCYELVAADLDATVRLLQEFLT